MDHTVSKTHKQGCPNTRLLERPALSLIIDGQHCMGTHNQGCPNIGLQERAALCLNIDGQHCIKTHKQCCPNTGLLERVALEPPASCLKIDELHCIKILSKMQHYLDRVYIVFVGSFRFLSANRSFVGQIVGPPPPGPKLDNIFQQHYKYVSLYPNER